MDVKMVSYSQGTDGRNLLEQVAYVARVSNPANQNNNESAEKLVRYLIKHQHWSPLEMVNVCLEINTTRDIARQILRHRSFSFQEFSQRYAVVDFGIAGSNWVSREARLQDQKNRQNSIETENLGLQETWKTQQSYVTYAAEKAYNWAIENGIAKEQARVVLPEGLTASRLYMNGTLRSWVHYIQLRSANGTQKEHQEIAIACAKAIEPIFPMIEEFVQQ
jgi:thymidylate synthase (FAD)